MTLFLKKQNKRALSVRRVFIKLADRGDVFLIRLQQQQQQQEDEAERNENGRRSFIFQEFRNQPPDRSITAKCDQRGAKVRR